MTHDHVRTTCAVVLVLAIIGAIFFHEYQAGVREDAKRDALIASLETQNKTLELSMKTISEAATKQVDGLETIKKNIQTPTQAIRIIHDQIPLPVQNTVRDLPDSPGALVVPKENQVALAKYSVDCEECQVKLRASTQELAALTTENENLKKERDAAVTASRGGSAWKRTWRIIKVAAIAGGTGYVLGKVSKK